MFCVAHHDDLTETRYERADNRDERATALVLVVDGGRLRLGSAYPARGKQERFGRPEPELIEASAGTIGMLHGFARVASGESVAFRASGPGNRSLPVEA